MTIRYPTYEYLHRLLRYDMETGMFVWISPPNNHYRLLETVAGCSKTGYIMIKIDGQKYPAHRLAWLYVYGALPNSRIDHKDCNPLNNRIANLRLATQAQNCANASRWKGRKLPKGVRQALSGRFLARISFEKSLITLGTFDTVAEAEAAYFEAATALYGEFARAS